MLEYASYLLVKLVLTAINLGLLPCAACMYLNAYHLLKENGIQKY